MEESDEREDKIEYVQEREKINFRYTYFARGEKRSTAIKLIPKKIVEKGEEAIRNHVDTEISAFRANWGEKDAAIDKIRNNPPQIEAIYRDGTPLRGRIVDVNSVTLSIALDSPVKGERSVNRNMASAMSGNTYLDRDYKLTDHAIEVARTNLEFAYEDHLFKPIADLVDKLNRKTD